MVEEEPKQANPAKLVKPPRLWAAVRAVLRTRIVAGLLTMIPIWVTWKAIEFVFGIMTSATRPLVEKVTTKITEQPPDTVPKFITDHLDWADPVFAILLTLFLLYVFGLLGANVFGRRLIILVESIFEKLPLVKTIYKATKQIVMTLGGSQTTGFQRVVLVEFPRPGMKCIGFLTAVMKDMDTGREMASVFISTTPNPTTGYMQILPLEEVSETGWTVEEAIKLLMSGGIVSPPEVAFDRIHPVKWDAEAAKARRRSAESNDADAE